jgi:predicted HAD superfamily Cof-like phosphohydrolase
MTLIEVINEVEKFHNAFGIKNHYQPKSNLTEAECELRFNLMKEENEEYLEAAKRSDIVHFMWNNFKTWASRQNYRSVSRNSAV